jgi:Ca-activated chloride channel homolog
MKRLIAIITGLLAIALLSACGAATTTTRVATSYPAPTMTYPPATTRAPTLTYSSTTVPAPTTGGGNIGLAAGGAKDVSNFRENIRNNFLPQPSDVTYEGLFYDYFFDTGATEPARKLYSPSYSFAVTRDPISRQTEYYMSVGLNSGLKQSDFERKTLNLAIVIDTSGSMNESYNQYYYDGSGREVDAYSGEGLVRKTKMQSAAEAVVSILDQLREGDRVAVVTFNSRAFLDKPLGPVGATAMRSLKNHVLDITPGGSTNQEDGMRLGSEQFKGLNELSNYEYENRMIVLTDAQPNTGETSASGLLGIARSNASRRIYTTFIGIGVDFNSQLIENITKIKGANYYSVHSPAQFRARVEDEFDYMVTPLVFNLHLSFQSDDWRIEKVFGSPEADAASGSIMSINTLFAAKSEEGENRGGIVLMKLRKVSSRPDPRVYLRTTYEDRNGRVDGDESTVYLESQQPEYFPNSGIRKAVLLTRYASLMRNWMLDERQHINYSRSWDARVREDCGIVLPPDNLGQWERTSLPLTVSPPYRSVFRSFAGYFSNETSELGDRDLDQETRLLDRLSGYGR